MKYSSCAFLARAHIRSGRRSTSVFVLLLLSIVLLTLVLSFASTMNRVIDTYQNQDPIRRLRISSAFINLGYTPLTDAVLAEIAQMEHVESVDQIDDMQYQLFSIKGVTDEKGKDCSNMLPVPLEESVLETRSLYPTQQMDVIEGKGLEESPVFSCILPDVFYTADNVDLFADTLKLQDGSTYIGKTFTVKAFDSYMTTYYQQADHGGYITQWWYLPALEYKLEVVGIYHASYDNYGGPNIIYVSHETGVQIQEMAVKATENPSFIAEYYQRKNNPEVNAYTVLVDTYDHVGDVYQQLEDRKITTSGITEVIIPDSVQLLSAVFTGAGNFLTFAILVLAVVNLFLSVSGALADRKGEVGLLKAIGYKDRQVFFCFYLEHVKIALRAFVLGALLSGAAVLCINWINGSGPFQNRIYVIRWEDFWLLCLLSFAIAVLVPLLCQLLMLPRLVKIQPRQAMGQL